ncbi:hypothetical protein EMMF5_000875 [Cystobasidiomycetes sp. EMM_F5]
MRKSTLYLFAPLLLQGLATASDPKDELQARHAGLLDSDGPPGDWYERGLDDDYGDLDERADPDCEPRGQPVIVYVTVTIDEQGAPLTETVTRTATATHPAATTTTGGGGGGGGPAPGGAGSDVGGGQSTLTSTISETRTNRPTVTTTAEGGNTGGGAAPPPATTSDKWSDWDSDEGEGEASASASASSTAGACTDCNGGDDGGNDSAGFNTFRTLPIIASISICVFTSVLAGVLTAR